MHPASSWTKARRHHRARSSGSRGKAGWPGPQAGCPSAAAAAAPPRHVDPGRRDPLTSLGCHAASDPGCNPLSPREQKAGQPTRSPTARTAHKPSRPCEQAAAAARTAACVPQMVGKRARRQRLWAWAGFPHSLTHVGDRPPPLPTDDVAAACSEQCAACGRKRKHPTARHRALLKQQPDKGRRWAAGRATPQHMAHSPPRVSWETSEGGDNDDDQSYHCCQTIAPEEIDA